MANLESKKIKKLPEAETSGESKKSQEKFKRVNGKLAEEYDYEYEKRINKEIGQALKKRAPEGVDPEKHERCVLDVKKQGKSVGSAHAICTSSMKDKSKKKLKKSKSFDFNAIGQKAIKDINNKKAADTERLAIKESSSFVSSPNKKVEVKPDKKPKKTASDRFEEIIASKVAPPKNTSSVSANYADKFSADAQAEKAKQQSEENKQALETTSKMKEVRQNLADNLLDAKLIDAKTHKLMSSMDEKTFMSHIDAIKQQHIKEESERSPEDTHEINVKRSQNKLARLMQEHNEMKEESKKRLIQAQSEQDPAKRKAIWDAIGEFNLHVKKSKQKLDDHMRAHDELMSRRS